MAIILGRYVAIMLMLALTGSLAAKKAVPGTLGTMRTDNRAFRGGFVRHYPDYQLLSFFPVLALGPMAEQFAMLAGKTF